MTHPELPEALVALLAGDAPTGEKLERSLPLLGAALACDRVLLFLRHPTTRRSSVTHAWTRLPRYVFGRERAPWAEEPASLASDDPLFAEALRNPEALYIDDIESAGAEVLDRDYERRVFGHRALIHAPLHHEGLLYGILEPCVFHAPRRWRDRDRVLIAWTQRALAPLAAEYVAAHCP